MTRTLIYCILIGLVIITVIITSGIYVFQHIGQYNERISQRFTYEGIVTSIVWNSENLSTVFLNSNHQQIKIYGGKVDLKVGEKYILVLDGNGYLVSVTLGEN